MICEICKKKINKRSETPQEAMEKFAKKLKKELEIIKKEKNVASKQSKRKHIRKRNSK